jgi:lysozyme
MDLVKLKAQLVRHEGYVPHAYADSEGYWTIGVGHLIDKRLGGKLDADVIDLQLERDIARCVRDADTYAWFATLVPARQNVVLNLLFNLGKARFDKFVNTQAAMARGDIEAAAKGLEASKWYTQVGKRGAELVAQWRSGICS